MTRDLETAAERSRRIRPRAARAVAVLLFVLLSAPAVMLGASSGATGGARRLARELPREAERLGRLREPASTVQTELGVALDQLREVRALSLDPHYLPALVAVGRAYLAASGRDPVTGVQVEAGYAGLEPEIAADATRLGRSAEEAARVAAGTRRLSRALARSERRIRALRRALRRRGGPRR